jgi:hypothetical protein
MRWYKQFNFTSRVRRTKPSSYKKILIFAEFLAEKTATNIYCTRVIFKQSSFSGIHFISVLRRAEARPQLKQAGPTLHPQRSKPSEQVEAGVNGHDNKRQCKFREFRGLAFIRTIFDRKIP